MQRRITSQTHTLLIAGIIAAACAVTMAKPRAGRDEPGKLRYAAGLQAGTISTITSSAVCKAVTPEMQKAAGLVSPKAVLLRDTGLVRVAADAKTARARELNVLRIDMTGKGDFRGAIVKKLTARRGSWGTVLRFGPEVVMLTHNGKTVPVTVSCQLRRKDDSITGGLSLTAVARGVCLFGKTRREIRIVDGNCNFSFADAARPSAEKFGPFSARNGPPNLFRRGEAGDHIEVLKIDGAASDAGRARSGYVGQPIEINGTWYVVSVDGMDVRAMAIATTGVVSVPKTQWSCTLVGEKYFLRTYGSDRITVPADRYRLYEYQVSLEAEPGANGSIIRARGGERRFTVRPGKTTELKLGEPLAARMLATKAGRRVTFSLDLRDAFGVEVFYLVRPKGGRPPNPTFDVIDARGNVVHSATLEYG